MSTNINKTANKFANKYENWKQRFKKHSYLQITDNSEIVIDNCRSVTNYDENVIELELAGQGLVVLGQGLIMSNFSTEGVIIRGEIAEVKFKGRKC